MKNAALAFVLCVGLIWSASPSRGQEIQVAFDAAGEVNTIDAELERRLNLFPEVEGFREARLYRLSDEAFELVIQYSEGGQVVRDRRRLSTEEVRALRQRVDERMQTLRTQRIDQEGRYKFLAATTLLGAEQGILLPIALGVESDRALASLPLFGAAGGFLIPFLLTQNASVTEAQATMTVYGGLQGITHGALLTLLLGGDDPSDEALSGAVALMSGAQAAAGFAYTDDWGIQAGTAELMTFGSLFGLGYGAATSALIVGDDFDGDVARLTGGTGLVGSLGGALAAYRLAQRRHVTQGDARLLARLGVLGTEAAVTIGVLMGIESTRPTVAMLMAGTLAGLGGGWYAVNGRDFTRGQANVMWLGSLAGNLLGAALSISLDASSEMATTLSTLGAGAGLGLTYALYARRAPETAAAGWQLDVNPAGALAQAGLDIPVSLFTLRRTW